MKFIVIILIYIVVSIFGKISAIDVDIVPSINTSKNFNSLEVTTYGDFLLENLYWGITVAYANINIKENTLFNQLNVLENTNGKVYFDNVLTGVSFKYDYFFYNYTNLYYRTAFLFNTLGKTYYSKTELENFANYTLNKSTNMRIDPNFTIINEVGYAFGNLGLAVNYNYMVFANIYNYSVMPINVSNTADIDEISKLETSVYNNKRYSLHSVGFKIFYLINYSSK